MLATLLLSLATSATPVDAPFVHMYTGIARAASGESVLYREDHYRYTTGGEPHVLVLYRCPDGKPFARKTADVRQPLAPDFDLYDARNGYREGVRTRQGVREVYVHAVGAEGERSARLPAASTPVIDSGFDAFVRAHWDALAAGKHLKINFLVPSRLKFMDFVIMRHHDAAAAKRGEMVLRLKLDSWIAFALPHIDVGYDRDNHRLRWFRGLSNLRDLRGDNITVVLRYPPDLRKTDVPVQTLEAARTAPLDGRCRLR